MTKREDKQMFTKFKSARAFAVLFVAFIAAAAVPAWACDAHAAPKMNGADHPGPYQVQHAKPTNPSLIDPPWIVN